MGKSKNLRNVSVIQNLNGNSIVIINDIRFKGKRAINWDDVKAYIEEFVGEDYTIAETSDVIYIGTDLPDEFTGSKYTESLKGANAKAKANAKFGWYRYDSRFALPVYDNNNEVERYNVFHASMLIRCANDGKMYLYDIIDIKKETGNPLG